MSIYSRDKCSDKALAEFKKKVCKYLITNGVDIKAIKMRCQRNYDGNIKVFTYKTEMRNNKTSRRYCTVAKDNVAQDGYYRGHFDTVIQMGVFFYRSEWDYYLAPEQADQRKWDLEDIKKHIELRTRKDDLIK